MHYRVKVTILPRELREKIKATDKRIQELTDAAESWLELPTDDAAWAVSHCVKYYQLIMDAREAILQSHAKIDKEINNLQEL